MQLLADTEEGGGTLSRKRPEVPAAHYLRLSSAGFLQVYDQLARRGPLAGRLSRVDRKEMLAGIH